MFILFMAALICLALIFLMLICLYIVSDGRYFRFLFYDILKWDIAPDCSKKMYVRMIQDKNDEIYALTEALAHANKKIEIYEKGVELEREPD